MNFQDLLNVNDADYFLELAFSKAKKRASEIKSSGAKGKNDELNLAKIIAYEKINVIKATLDDPLDKITKSFPNIDGLPEFYIELIKLQIDYPYLKKSLGSIPWAQKKVHEFSKLYGEKIRATKEPKTISIHMKAYYGRIASTLKQINKHLKFLEESRKTMKHFPNVKTKLYTIALFGFPNVGKSTLLSKLTTAKPEIKDYEFTTKSINIGYYQDEMVKIQFLDTPGALGRIDKLNLIEKQAYLAVKYCSQMIIYVIDLTESVPLERQIELLQTVHKKYARSKDFLVYLSKTDIIDPTKIEKFKKENSIYTFYSTTKDLTSFVRQKAMKTNF